MTQFLTPNDYNADELRLSLLRMASSSKKQSRAFCPNGEGNGVTNNCGTGTSYAIASDAITQSIPEANRAAVRLGLEQVFFDRGQLEDGVPFKTTTKVAEVAIKRPEYVLERAKAIGIKDPSSIPVIGCGTIPDAMVRISPFAADDGIRIKSTIPLGDGPTSSATVEVGISGLENPKVKYGFFDLTPKAKQQIDDSDVSLTRVSATLLSVMSASLEAAEKNGFSEAVTDAAGNGIGRFASGPSDALQGYRLWPKFGFDADVGSMITERFILETNPATGKPFRDGLSYEAKRRASRGESLRVQEIIETKQGEEWWNKHGSGMVMTLDFSNKTSLGYRRYKEMLAVGKKMAARLGKQGRSAFEFWLWAAEETGMPEFRNCEIALFPEHRAFCPNGEGNGVTNTCSAKDSPAQETEEDDPPPALHLLAERDAEAPQTKMKSGDGEVTVVDRKGIGTPDYLDEIECHGRNCGLDVTFEEAKALQPDSDIKDDWSPLDAYVGPGAGYFTGQSDHVGSDSIDFHGVDYGTIDDYQAGELLAADEAAAEAEWDAMSEEEKSEEAFKLVGGSGYSSEEERIADAKKDWLQSKGWEIQERIDEMRQEARLAAVEQMKKELESAVAADTIECCLQLYRGMNIGPGEVDNIIRDGYVTHEGVNSWTTSRGTARSFGANRLLLVTRKPRVGHIFASNAHDEKEVIRPPSRMRILGVVRTKTGTVLHVDEDEDYKEA